MSREAEDIWRRELYRVQKKHEDREVLINKLGVSLVTYVIASCIITFVGGATGILELIRGTSPGGTVNQIASAKMAAVVAGTGAVSAVLFAVATMLLAQWCRRERRRTAKRIQDLEAGLEAERKLTAQGDRVETDARPIPGGLPVARSLHHGWMADAEARLKRRGQLPPVVDEDHPRSA